MSELGKLSKSRYTSGIQCHKMLWLKKNKPELASDSGDASKMEEGVRMGALARGFFGDYVEVAFDTDYEKMADKTRELIEARVPIICEATFIHDGHLCMVDILRVSADGTLDIVEAKSSTKSKPINHHDVSYQAYIVESCGYKVNTISLLFVNNAYKLDGELDIQQLFWVDDVTDKARKLMELVPVNMEAMLACEASDDEPEMLISSHCNNPYECPFKQYCWGRMPSPNVFDLVNGARKAPKLRDAGIISFEDLYDSVEFTELTDKQKKQVTSYIEDKLPIVNEKALREFLRGLWYPMHFLDFESFQLACPIYDGAWPYEQIVTQYSLHYLDKVGDTLKHAEFLAEEGKDPRRSVAEALVHDIPTDACIIVWNETFEKGRIEEMADMFPDLSEHLMALHANVRDLMVPFRNFDYYRKEFGKSSSIKAVLPGMFPDDPRLDYHALEGVQNGTMAANAYMTLMEYTPSERAVIREQLLRYCELDTYAMVVIWDALVDITGGMRSNIDIPVNGKTL